MSYKKHNTKQTAGKCDEDPGEVGRKIKATTRPRTEGTKWIKGKRRAKGFKKERANTGNLKPGGRVNTHRLARDDEGGLVKARPAAAEHLSINVGALLWG